MNTRHGRRIVVAVSLLMFPYGLWTEAATSDGGVFSGIQDGNRVCVELSTRSHVSGIVQAVTTDSITLDLQWNENGIEGVIQFPTRQVLRAYVLPDWNAGELAIRRTDRTQRQKEAEGEIRRVAAKREAVIQVEKKTARLANESKAKKIPLVDGQFGGLPPGEYQKGIELLLKYPPREGWGTSSDKTIDWLKVKFSVIGALLTPAEKEFLDNYDLWCKVKTFFEAKLGKSTMPQGPGNTSPDNVWLTENQPPDLPIESPPASMLPSAFSK